MVQQLFVFISFLMKIVHISNLYLFIKIKLKVLKLPLIQTENASKKMFNPGLKPVKPNLIHHSEYIY